MEEVEGEEEEGEGCADEVGEEAEEGGVRAQEEEEAEGGQVDVKRTALNAARRLCTHCLPKDTPKAKVVKCLSDPTAEDLAMDIPTVLLQE